MDLARKTELAAQAINSISRHDDEDAAVRKALLDRVIDHVLAEKVAMDARVEARLAELVGTGSEAA